MGTGKHHTYTQQNIYPKDESNVQLQVHNLGPGCFCCMRKSESSPIQEGGIDIASSRSPSRLEQVTSVKQEGGSEDGMTYIQQNIN